MNYGETLSYWYLRLNGFFPLSNFALHRYQHKGRRKNADTDILAVRWPHVYEKIGGHLSDWDVKKFEEWKIDFEKNIVGLIVEVKTGSCSPEDITKAFGKTRLLYALRRFGFWNESGSNRAATELSSYPIYCDANIVIGKLLVAVEFPDDSQMEEETSKVQAQNDFQSGNYLRLDLKEAEKIILQRVKTYNDPKYASRMFFPNDLMQYLIWSQKS